jgi:mannosyltransferase OCH1-like enzyme
MIPKRLVRTVPAVTSDEVEGWWEGACKAHPDWDHVTWRDPIDPLRFPITAKHWKSCTSGAQLAGLIRLEDLWHSGGIYLDSDVQVYRSFEPLRFFPMFAGWEDPGVVPDAILGAVQQHPAIELCLHEALRRLGSKNPDWRSGAGAWSTGPGVTTSILPGRCDVLLLPPAAFYPVHYTDKQQTRRHEPAPYSFAIHHWNASWL